MIGDVLVAALLEYRAFKPVDSAMVYVVLAAYAVGLLASSSSRVMSSAFYALRDTRTPARIAYVRIAFSIAVGLSLMFPLDRISVTVAGESRQLGAVGLALGASAGAWLEYTLLRRRLAKALGPHSPPASAMAKIAIAGAAAAAVGVGAKLLLGSVFPARPGWVEAWLGAGSWATPLVLGAGTALLFGVTYLSVASALGEGALLARLLRR